MMIALEDVFFGSEPPPPPPGPHGPAVGIERFLHFQNTRETQRSRGTARPSRDCLTAEDIRFVKSCWESTIKARWEKDHPQDSSEPYMDYFVEKLEIIFSETETYVPTREDSIKIKLGSSIWDLTTVPITYPPEIEETQRCVLQFMTSAHVLDSTISKYSVVTDVANRPNPDPSTKLVVFVVNAGAFHKFSDSNAP